MVAQQLLDLVTNVIAGPCFRVRVRVRVFHHIVYSVPHGSTTIVRFITNAIAGPCYRVRVRARVFHHTVYHVPHGSTITVRFSYKCNC
jgi:hypothetical protein